MPAVPANFNYSDNTGDPDLPKFDVTVAGRAGVEVNSAGYRRIIDAGHRVAQYINIVDVNGFAGSALQARFMQNAPALSASNWPGYKIVDISNAAHRVKLVENCKYLVSLDSLTDVFWDVFGERLWTAGGWGSMSKSQQDAFSKYMEELGYQLGDVRDAYRPDCYYWFNGTWASGHRAGCPVIEHHGLGEKGYWAGYVDPSKWDPKAQGGEGAAFWIAFNVSEGQQWATVKGSGPVACQGTYDQAPSAALPMARLKARTGSTTPVPPPSPPPVPVPGLSLPAAPRNVTASGASGRVLVTWAPSPEAEKVDFYRVYINDQDARGPRDMLAPATQYVTTDADGIVPGREFTYRVSAHNGAAQNNGHGPWSDPVKFTVPTTEPTEPPPAPMTDAELHALTVADLEMIIGSSGSTVLTINQARQRLAGINGASRRAAARFNP